MFERFTDRARRVLVLAQEEARLLAHNFIGSEHILLGLVREGDGVAARALTLLDIRLEAVREKVQETVGPASASVASSPPFTPRAKKVLELSLREALQLGHNYIGTEHILLGLVREGEGVASQVLVALGADLSQVRQQVLLLVAGGPADVAALEAIATSQGPVGPRCGRCRTALSGSLPYTSLQARPSQEEAEQGRGPLTVTVLYCGSCGAVILPAQEAATGLRPYAFGTSHVGGPRLEVAVRHSGKLPSDLLGPVGLEDVPEAARVELVYHDSGVIEGTVGGAAVHVSGLGQRRQGSADGTWGEVELAAAWSVGAVAEVPESHTTQSQPVVPGGFEQPAVMSGRFGQLAIELKGEFQLSPALSLERAGLSGELGGQEFRAEVSAADGGLGTTSAVVAEGMLGEAPFELFVAYSDDSKSAVVRGSIGATPVSLDATRSGQASAALIIGSYSGEPPLLALLAAAVVRYL